MAVLKNTVSAWIHLYPLKNQLPACDLPVTEIAMKVGLSDAGCFNRGVRWDSDHVVTFNDDLQAIPQEIVRNDALERGWSRKRAKHGAIGFGPKGAVNVQRRRAPTRRNAATGRSPVRHTRGTGPAAKRDHRRSVGGLFVKLHTLLKKSLLLNYYTLYKGLCNRLI